MTLQSANVQNVRWLYWLICITDNKSPRFDNADNIVKVEVGKSYPDLMQLVVVDDNDDPISLYLSANAPAGLSVNSDAKWVQHRSPLVC